MKKLILSLLRIGDFFQLVPLAEEQIRQGHKIHFVVNANLNFLPALFPQFQFHFFPRELLQSLLGSHQANLLSSYQVLQDFLTELESEKFDEISNWTHNFLSARLMDCLEAPQKRGARFEGGRVFQEQSSLFKEFNSNYSTEVKPTQLFVDALAEALGLDFPPLAQARESGAGPVYLQALTSDERKSWPLQSWIQLAEKLSQTGRDVRFVCAPHEMEILGPALKNFKFPIESLLFSQVQAAFQQASLVVSGDTSILHFAALLKVPCLGIYLGPANIFKTSPRLMGARVLTASLPCSPCSPRGACEKSHFECHSKISTQDVLDQCQSLLNNEEPTGFLQAQLSWVVESFDGSARVVQIHRSQREKNYVS